MLFSFLFQTNKSLSINTKISIIIFFRRVLVFPLIPVVSFNPHNNLNFVAIEYGSFYSIYFSYFTVITMQYVYSTSSSRFSSINYSSCTRCRNTLPQRMIHPYRRSTSFCSSRCRCISQDTQCQARSQNKNS